MLWAAVNVLRDIYVRKHDGHGQRTAERGGTPTPNERKYWFPAKRYGWGWGIPRSWQGWLVLAAFVGLLAIGSFLFPPNAKFGAYLAYVAVLCVLLVGTCWLKGEPPRWRWGNDESA